MLSLQDRREAVAISWREEEERKRINFPELYIETINYSKGFLEQGLKPEDNVAIFTRNSPHWLSLVLGMNNAGISDVPRELFTEEEAKSIITHSDSKIVIVENQEMLKLARPYFSLEKLFSIEQIPGIRNVREIYEQGKDSTKEIPRISPNTRASIIYTSGTTGEPKGAMLSHNNYISNLEAILRRIPLSQSDKFLAMLPQWHVYGRIAILAAAYLGAETFYVTNLKNIASEMQREKPSVMATVPRVWEIVYKNFVEEVRKKGSIKKFFSDKLIEKDIEYMLKGKIPGKIHTKLEHEAYSKLREKLGGNLHRIVSGGSAMPHYLKAFFYTAGLKIAEGYGMTETSPLISGSEQDLNSLFTTGPPLDNIEIRILDPNTGRPSKKGMEGVIHVKGPNVMLGYYKNQKATDEVLKEGWMNTGDLGYFVNENLKVTGRIGDNIKLSNGEMINPQRIESLLSENNLIGIPVVIGRGWKSPAALIMPNYNDIIAYAKNHKIHYDDPKELIYEPKIIELYKDAIKEINKQNMQKFERINDFVLIPELETGNGLTATRKIKRPEVERIYKKEIEQLESQVNK